MGSPILFLALKIAILSGLVTAPMPAQGTELSEAIEPLERPDLASAKIAISNLDALAAKSNGEFKMVVGRLNDSIKQVFTAEYRVNTAIKEAEISEQEAVRETIKAKGYLKPNAFGNVRHKNANRCIEKAKKLRKEAAAKIIDRRMDLLAKLRELDTLANDFYIERAAAEAMILHKVVVAVASRALGDVKFSPTLTQKSIASLQEFVAHSESWKVEAREAEEAGNHNKAFELYTKSGDQTGRQRAAKALAKELENGGFYGSAIEYYEKGGDYQAAKRLRRDHPEILAATFKKLNGTALYAKVAPCVVKVRTDNGHGSGFVFRYNGYIMTNAHVVEDADQIEVVLYKGRTLPARVKAIDKKYDLAVLQIETPDKLDYLRFAREDEVEIGTEIAAVGYPKLDLPTATMNTGSISNNDRSFQGIRLVQLDVSINKGNSGGPIVDQRGRVMGIVTFTFDRVIKADRFNFAVSLYEIERFLKSQLGEDFITR